MWESSMCFVAYHGLLVSQSLPGGYKRSSKLRTVMKLDQPQPQPQLPNLSRRQIIQATTTALLSAIQTQPAQAVSNRSLINGVLSGYGLPTLEDEKGFVKMLQQIDNVVVEFLYPVSWIVSTVGADKSKGGLSTAASERASPLTVGDYRRAEGASLYIQRDIAANHIKDMKVSDIASVILPGDATRHDSEYTLVASRPLQEDPNYCLYEFKFETTTVSGYQVERRNLTCATVVRGLCVSLSASCSAQRYKEMAPSLKKIATSFRVAVL